MNKIKHFNIIIIPILILSVISLFNMVNAPLINSIYSNAFIKQSIWVLIGFLIIFIIKKIKINKLFKYSKYLYFFSILLLILVLIFGNSINGAKCWLNLFGLSIQPSEIVKITLTLYLINTLNSFKGKNNIILVIKLLIITLIPSILVFLEPDTGAIINYFIIFIVVLLNANLNKWWYIIGIGFCIISTISLFLLYFFAQDLLIKIIGTSLFYRMDRIITFLSSTSYQLENALITVGSASLFGVGFNKIVLYIPEAPTDFIFAFSIGNFGIISAFLIILSYLFLDMYLLFQKLKVKKTIYKAFISSYLSIIIFHQIYNISMNIGLLPIMGIPLPFLSYGGSNTIINFIFIAIIINIVNKKTT